MHLRMPHAETHQKPSRRKSRRVAVVPLANALLANAWEEGLKRFLGTRSPGRSLR